MDSRLLNVVYDDPFDGNYTKYDNDTEFWSSGSDTMGMQLTETLHGILPIAPTDDFRKEDGATALQSSKNMFSCEEFDGHHLTTGGAIEIITVDPNADIFDSDSEEYNVDNVVHNGVLEFDRQSQCSNLTFRTRTDSSSIGDYESHSSDYDDDDENELDNHYINGTFNKSIVRESQNHIDTKEKDLHIDHSLVTPDDIILGTTLSTYHKNRTNSTNTINSDVDGFGLNIDVNTFDLAEFITKDDFTMNSTTENIASTQNGNRKANGMLPNTTAATALQVISSNTPDTDSDSDIIVDVETIEADDADNVNSLRKASEVLHSKAQQDVIHTDEYVQYVDNMAADPSWMPGPNAKHLESSKSEERIVFGSKQNCSRNITIVPNKKQCDLLKGKFAKCKTKVVQRPPKASKCMKSNESSTTKIQFKSEKFERKTGMGMGGKNLALLKIERPSISEQSSEENSTPLKCQIKTEPKVSPLSPSVLIKNEKTPAQNAAQAVKRKLNLEEYKKRRGDTPMITTHTKDALESNKIPKLEEKDCATAVSSVKNPVNNSSNSVTKHSDEVISVVKSLKEKQNQQHKPVVDPITEAKNKVLRMQELKKAQQLRIIDSTISAKVPRVTKLLPLREIVKGSPYLNDGENADSSAQSLKSHLEYEEIIIVSVSSNTDISIPPTENPYVETVNTATRSLLKSSALLSTISSTFKKVNAIDNVKISTNSLIASIQDVVVKSALPVNNKDENCTKELCKPEHHGEDKIIMHLRKDRIRKKTCTVGLQTDLQTEFPPLLLPKTSMLHKSRDRMRKHRKRQYRKRKETLSLISSNDSSDEQSDHSTSSSVLRSRDNSSSSSLERVRTYDSAIGTGGYSSRSSRKHRSSVSSSNSDTNEYKSRGRRQRRTSYKQRSSRKKSPGFTYSSSSTSSDTDRSRSPTYRRSRSRSNSQTSRSRRSNYRQNKNYADRNISQPAVEERRIVYVGRIEQDTTKDMLRRKFIQYGTIKQISIHYKDTGMKYGFVTFERSQDAFNAIDNSTRDPQINMYDVSFGGRRAFCRASYADLDNAGINTYQSYVFPQQQQPKEEDSFEALLLKMKAKLSANKNVITTTSTSSTGVTSNGKI